VKLAVVAVGRLKAGPERDLSERYRGRIDAIGRSSGFSALEIVEIPESRARREADRRSEEAGLISQRTRLGVTVAFDERSRSLTSQALGERLRHWRDEGRPAAAFLIGGADGLDPALRERADLTVSFGALTLPHQLVRVLVLEQIYRCLTILAGHPYHREG
jgi:23S rRNA (pseudouridine1915-N3)-methyltransferase